MARRKSKPVVDDRAGVVELPPIPAFVFSALGEIPVGFVSEIVADGKPDKFALGYANFHTRTIAIREGLSIAAQWHTLLHEAAHFLLWDAGIKLTDKEEEMVADAYATYRFQEMVTRRD